jgi:hypothetical protein
MSVFGRSRHFRMPVTASSSQRARWSLVSTWATWTAPSRLMPRRNWPRSFSGLGECGRHVGTRRNCLSLDTNPHSLVRAAAIDKLWREGWAEPVPPPFQVHVMAQQAHRQVLERGAIPLPELGSFRHSYEGLVECLLKRGMLHQDGGVASIGHEAQRLWGARNYMELLSVFDTPESRPIDLARLQSRPFVRTLTVHAPDPPTRGGIALPPRRRAN